MVLEFHSQPNYEDLNKLKDLFSLLREEISKKVLLLFQDEKTINTLKSNMPNLTCEEQIDVHFTIDDLQTESQDYLFKKCVIFQGIATTLNDLVVKEDFLAFQDDKLLSHLINNDKLIVGKQIVGVTETMLNYIDRKFCMKKWINKKILASKSDDCILAISSYNKKFLLLNKKKHKAKLHLLNCKNTRNDFERLCEGNPTKNIHWLKVDQSYDGIRFICQQTQHKVSQLEDYFDEENMEFSEVDLVHETNRKYFLISDKAGMGKSTVLTKLSSEIKSQNESAWVIKIDLNICSQQFKSFNFEDINNEDKIIDFISFSLLNHQDGLEQALFKYFIHCKNRLIVLLDGFDEISPDYDSIVTHLMEFLSERVKQLWVTTRPTSKQCLQDALETLSFTLKPFTNEDQVLFLTKYWSKYVLPDNAKIELFAKELLQQMSVSIQSKTFTDNPLQECLRRSSKQNLNNFIIRI